MSEFSADESRYLNAALHAARAARQFLERMEQVAEQLAPQRSADLARSVHHQFTAMLDVTQSVLDSCPPPVELAPFADRLAEGFREVRTAADLFTGFPSNPPQEAIPRILGALHHCARAQETFYYLRQALPPFNDYWPAPPGVADAPARDDEGSPTGVIHVGRGGNHGGFSVYIPEHYTAERSWSVIIALHGGSGNGRDFLWTWVREAKQRSYIAVAPNAVHETWSEVEDRGLFEVLGWLMQHYHIAPERILLTGLSDGATFSLLYGLAHPQLYRALAPLCGVLHPANETLGNLRRASGVPIYLVHGALDFVFPVELARMACDSLTAAGAALEYRELPQLSHTYPRSENLRILHWFEGLPGRVSSTAQ